MTTDFCREALEEAINKYGTPEIFNTDQGSQFTSEEFTRVLRAHDIKISMDGKGRWVDNVFIERLWKASSTSTSTCMPMRAWMRRDDS
jgi:putative transposase